MRALVLAAVPLVAVVAIVACNRYEYRTIDCGPPPPPGAGSAIAWETAPGDARSLSLRVTTVAGGDGVAYRNGASTRLGALPWRGLSPDGRARFDSLAPGRYELAVRMLGHQLAQATVSVQADSGVTAHAVMARHQIVINEACGFHKYRARKPWWKF